MGFVEIGIITFAGLILGFWGAKALTKSKELKGTIIDMEKINEYLYKIKLKTSKGKIVETLIFSSYSLNKGLKVLLERREENIFVIKKVSI